MNTENATTQELETSTETVQTGSDDQPAATALGILQEMEAQTTGEPKTDPEPDPTPDESEEDDESTDEEDEANSNDETPEDQDEDEPEAPSLDESIQATLKEHNPDAIKRWNEQWKGLSKREAKVAEWEDGIKSTFEDLDYALETVPIFLQKLAGVHQVPIQKLVGLKETAEATFEPDDDRFATDVEREHDNVIREQAAAIKALEAKLERFDAQQKAEREKAERQIALDQQLGRVQKVFDKEHGGFKVTRKMLGDAVTAFPTLDPIKAVKAMHTDALVAHAKERTSKAFRVTAPVTPKSNTSKGITLPEGDRVRAADLLDLLPK